MPNSDARDRFFSVFYTHERCKFIVCMFAEVCVTILSFHLQNGIVHRDLKLENILLDHENNAKVSKSASYSSRNYIIAETQTVCTQITMFNHVNTPQTLYFANIWKAEETIENV